MDKNLYVLYMAMLKHKGYVERSSEHVDGWRYDIISPGFRHSFTFVHTPLPPNISRIGYSYDHKTTLRW